MKRVLAALAFLALAPPALGSGDMDRLLCGSFLLQEEQAYLDLQLDADLARSEEEAAGEIFGLLESLRRNGHVERMIYLAGKHQRDLTALTVKRRKLQVQRQDALLQQYRPACGASEGGSSLSREQREKGEEAARLYARLDCDIRTLDISIQETNLAFQQELRDSVHELRQGEVATIQDVIITERDLEIVKKRLAQARERSATCRSGLQVETN